MSDFHNRLRELKERSHLTLKEMSEDLNISTSNLSYYMKDREPSYDTLIEIADYFDVTTDWLLGVSDARNEIQDLLAFKVEEQKSIEEHFGYNSDLPADEVDQSRLLHGDVNRTYLYIQKRFYESLTILYGLLLSFYNSKDPDFQKNGYTYLSLMTKTFHGFLSYFDILLAMGDDKEFFTKDKVLEIIKYGELSGTLQNELFHKFSYEFIPFIISLAEVLKPKEKEDLTSLLTYLSSKYNLEHPMESLKEYDKYIYKQRAEAFQKLYQIMTPEEIEDSFESYIHNPTE